MPSRVARYRPVADAGLAVIDQLAEEIAAFPLGEDLVETTAETLPGADLDWQTWATRFIPTLFRSAPAEHHRQAWEWFDTLPAEETPPALILAWNRGGAKSGIFEGATARLCFTLHRRFVLYVSETQKQADEHVSSIGTLLLKAGVERSVNEYGFSNGWTGQKLRSANGFNVLALGLDAAGRGLRLDEFRPDLILFDDIDGRHDTKETTKKKLATITQTIIPSGSAFCAVAFGQNVILKGGLMDQLVTGAADWLSDRIVSFVQAVRGLKVEQKQEADGTFKWHITAGEATWPQGLPLSALLGILRKVGLPAFRREYQHEIDEEGGGLWDGITFRYLTDKGRPFPVSEEDGLPPFLKIAVAIDPSGSKRGDEVGIVGGGLFRLPSTEEGKPGKLAAVILEDSSDHLSPAEWAAEGVGMHRRHRAKASDAKLLAESNFGGEMVEATIQTVDGAPLVVLIHASRGKEIRAEPAVKLYEEGRVWHAKRFPNLEGQQKRWHPASGLPSPGALDAAVMVLAHLFAGETPPDKPVYRPSVAAARVAYRR